MKSAASLLFMMLLVLSGCTSVSTKADKGHHLAAVRHFFVLSNLNDNHAIDESIARALRAHGFQAESGPLTMMPDTAQALITYEDRWLWDFSSHMVHLRISAQEPQAFQPYATVTYHKNVALSTEVDAVVDQLIGDLLKSAK